MTTTDTALLPPDPSVPGFYWLRHESGHPDEIWEWVADDMIWRRDLEHIPAGMTRLGYILASPPIPGPAALEAIYALARPPDGPSQPASPFAVGYTAGMGYLAEKLRRALETKETT